MCIQQIYDSAVILPKPKARVIWLLTSNDQGRGPYICCICRTSHGSYDILFYSECVDYVWPPGLFRSVAVIWTVAAQCCLLWEGEWRGKKKENADYCWVLVDVCVHEHFPLVTASDMASIAKTLGPKTSRSGSYIRCTFADQKHQGQGRTFAAYCTPQ